MARLGRIETTVGAMASDVSDLKTDVSGLKTHVSGLKTDVSDLKADVSDLKRTAWRVAEILADHSERLGGLQRTMDERLGGVNERLDRLIAATIQGRTADTERFGDIERRLARLEERVGV